MTSVGPAPRTLLKSPFPIILTVWIVVGALAAGVIAAVGSLTWREWTAESYFFWRQDLPVLGFGLGATFVLALAPTAWAARLWPGAGRPSRVAVALLAVLVFVAGAIGVSAVFFDYSFSLDEFLANFDAQIIAAGHTVAPVAAWREYAPAMQPIYMLPLPTDVWASSYLPVNASLRALGRLVHAEGLMNPALSAFAVIAVYAIGRRIWPDRPAPALIAAALLATSSQLIVMGMTAYAMPAHLAFNLAWLWLFLRGGRLGHAGAIVVGFLATGLHQLLFHPIFVAPFILQLWFQRRWALGVLYTVAYGLILGFWVEYWPLMQALNGVTLGDGDSTGGEYFFDRVSDAFDELQWRNLGVMAQCLLRFIAWQNLLTAPLALIGAVMAARVRGYLRPMALGVLLTLLAVFFATPTQTHGWGYRYLEGLMGSIALIAAWAWDRLTDGAPEQRRAAAAGAMALACAVSLIVLAPLHASQARAYVQPFAAANAAIQAARSDVVVVDHNSDVLFDMGTVVRNDPFLRRSPKVMSLADMTDDMVRDLCATHRVLVFNGRSAIAYGLPVTPWRGPLGIARLRAYMRQAGCYRVIGR